MSHTKTLLLFAVVLAIPIIPFVLLREQIEQLIQPWLTADVNQWHVAGLVVGLLSTDVFLPIPSSVLSTLAGSRLGFWLATASSWLGLTLGAVIGFEFAKACGPKLADRLAKPEDLRQMAAWSERYGSLLLVVTRAIPVFAEATVLLMGIHGLARRRFFWPVAFSNLGIAIAYSWLGKTAADNELLPAALGISVALPVLLTSLVRWKRSKPS